MGRQLVLFLAIACASLLANGPASAGDRLHVDGRWIKDSAGRVVILHGVNYSQHAKSAPYNDWQSSAHFDQVAGWGFNAMRYLVEWSAIEPKPGQIDEAYLDRVERALGWAEERGIYVLLDMHQDVWSDVFGGNGAPHWACVDDLVEPNVILTPWWKNYFTKEVLASFGKFWKDTSLQDHYAGAWAAVARRAARHTNVVGYDLMNEPFPGKHVPWLFEHGTLSTFYARVGTAIRAVDLHAALWAEPVAMTANEGIPSAVQMPPGPAVYVPHYYDFLLMLGKPYKNRKWLTERSIKTMEAQAASRGVPLLLGEIGCDRNDVGAVEAMSDQCDALDHHSAGWMAWEYTPDAGATGPIAPGGMSLIQNGVEHPGMAAFVRPYARAVAGVPRSSAFDRAARTFRFEYDHALVGQTTVIYLPRRHFPAPIIEATGHVSWDAKSETLTHTPDPALAAQRITVR